MQNIKYDLNTLHAYQTQREQNVYEQKKTFRKKKHQYSEIVHNCDIPILESSELAQEDTHKPNFEVLENPAQDNRGNITNESLQKTKKRARNSLAESNVNAETCFQVMLFTIFFI